MSRIPPNVQKTLDENRRLETATAHAKDLRTCNVKADWFQKDFQKLQSSGTRVTSIQGGLDAAIFTDAKGFDGRATGLPTGVAAIKATRQARLKELYESEALQYQEELESMGLSLVKPRD